MDKYTEGMMDSAFEAYFEGYCKEHETTYDQPEDMRNQIADAFVSGFPTKEAIFSYVRYMPDDERAEFLRDQLTYKPVDGIYVGTGSESEKTSYREVSDDFLELAGYGFGTMFRERTKTFEYYKVRYVKNGDSMKGFRAIKCAEDTGEEMVAAEFTFGRLLVYIAIGILKYSIYYHFVVPEEQYDRYLKLVKGE